MIFYIENVSYLVEELYLKSFSYIISFSFNSAIRGASQHNSIPKPG